MSIYKLCGAAICTLVGFLLLKEKHPVFASAVGMAGAVVILFSLTEPLREITTFLMPISEETAIGTYFPVLLKAFGTAAVVSFTADICREAGEAALGSKVEFAGKIEIILLSLPILKELSDLAFSILP